MWNTTMWNAQNRPSSMHKLCSHIIMHMCKYHTGIALYWNILKYPMILFADSEGPDQTAWMHRLIWVFAICICQKTCFRMALPILALKFRFWACMGWWKRLLPDIEIASIFHHPVKAQNLNFNLVFIFYIINLLSALTTAFKFTWYSNI